MIVKSIVLIEAKEMEKSKVNSQILDILKTFREFTHGRVINFSTNIRLEHPHPLVKVFNEYLVMLHRSGTDRVIISLQGIAG